MVGIVRMIGQGGLAHGLAQPAEDGVLIGADDDVPAVPGGIGVGRRDLGQKAACALTDLAGPGVVGDQALHHRHHRLEDGAVHHLATSGLLALVQRQQRAHGALDPGQGVAQRNPHPDRGTVRVAADVAQPAHGFAHRREAGTRRVGTVLAEAGDPHHDQPRVVGRQALVVQAPALHGAGAEVFDQHVGLGCQAPQQVLALGLAQIEGQRLLVAGDHVPPQRFAALVGLAPLAHGVALARWLDLDHLGAEVGQYLAAGGPGDQLAEFEHLEVVQRE